MRFLHFLLIFFILFFTACFEPNYGISKPNTPATMRAYTIKGKTYYPKYVRVGDTQSGIASWYGPGFHGKKTSNGETFNTNTLTAAHKTFPMNTMVRVDNLENSRSVIVRINDRGPFVDGRIIDLSNLAAHKLDMTKKGTARVKLTVVGVNSNITSANINKNTNIISNITSNGNYMLQLGAFSTLANANVFAKKYENFKGYSSKVIRANNLYKVFLTGFKSESEARTIAGVLNLIGAAITKE
ncbi:septal ring lytic transglycosylase RlpA family protein [Campylobacter canadensis]|uniref:Probable endolytic peptidoglycan transglycosylase RlpA n=1 Tax=Campylobacter canadensis TaxID=449520 RepID=A0ABS7WP87_9BACT|nr:septal ring lytic transglycosylase RlpA family protein [Campylobacter canadensis]MBZ7986583.1 septal ring lytic transglycosylase RlpA family protein [Campylobacter canadensis]MBZ7994012.1 septal ring lytic transglycosylase RlpA family protein [Campylobacter canadensis]MBZ7995985.1 septal ring lytic transglycosylase RlpA family protein [Campylobacter canadensis]MBZ7997619.1 septal ring lytic transglycosylase RlpA family protein [Campylobacter canadensis]MBZ7999343.1 septal ring lytic transgl